MEKPIISIITPAYNASDFIEETIASVLSQSFTSWEFIISDDGSTDDTIKKIIRASSGDSRIILNRYQHSGLPSVMRNKALKIARGDIIAFLDADDIWEPNKLSLQIDSLSKNNKDWGFANVTIFGGNEYQPSGLWYPPKWKPNPPFLRSLLSKMGVPLLSIVVKTDLLRKVCAMSDIGEAFDERKEFKGVEDWDLSIRLSKISEPDYIPFPIARYRIHGRGISWQGQKTNYERAMTVINKHRSSIYPENSKEKIKKYWLSKIAIDKMLDSKESWRMSLIKSCFKMPIVARDLYLAFLSFLPTSIAKKMYILGLKQLRKSSRLVSKN